MSNMPDARSEFHVVAECQILAEYDDGTPYDPTGLVNEMLHQASLANLIDNGHVIHAVRGPWGLTYVIFEADLRMYMRTKNKARKWAAEKRLNKIFPARGVNVRWIIRKELK